MALQTTLELYTEKRKKEWIPTEKKLTLAPSLPRPAPPHAKELPSEEKGDWYPVGNHLPQS